jgi:hypothetical protein
MRLIVGSLRSAKRGIGRLAGDRSGNSLIEFAISLPILLTLAMYGIELANMASINMQVSQIAMAVADNASRLGQTDNSAITPRVTNADIDSVMTGAMKQGNSINLQANGRVILSSLERDFISGRQHIHWQKCRGNLAQNSAYGPTGYGLTGTALPGIGKSGTISANANSAVMFAEVYYSYKPLFGTMFVNNVKFQQEAAFMIRDTRDLGKSLNSTPSDPGVTGSAGSSECP